MIQRQCRVCGCAAPDELTTESMTGEGGGWYSNALIDVTTGRTVRFFLCPVHRGQAWQSFGWAREELKRQLSEVAT